MKPGRALKTFAYVAEEFARTNDIAQGLVPLFAPIISRRAGTPFNPEQFAQDVRATYDLKLHPLVAEEFAPSLAARGYLDADRQAGVIHYTNLDCELPEPPIHETQLRQLVDGFLSFSEARLVKTGTQVQAEQLETALFDRLVQPDFLGLVLHPDRPVADPQILTLRRTEKKNGNNAAPNLEQQLDYLVASYILHVYRDIPGLFDSIVAAASGALVAEVVLDLQQPGQDVQPMSGIDVAIDSPLVLDAMELGHEGATPYAVALIEQVKKAGARPVVFAETLKEIHGALAGPLQNYENRAELYGPLGRRLRTNSAIAAYVRLVLPRLRDLIQDQLGVNIVEISSVDRARNRRYFTESHEDQMAKELGLYAREAARLHDARVVADVLRLRGGDHVTAIGQAGVVFVTRNGRLARRTRHYLTERSIIARNYFPPCISDSHLAGLLWISIGGGGDTLPRLRLVANCSAAVMPRRDLVSRMHRFFEDLNPAMEKHFQALMTNERAEHFLMDRTLSDVAMIRPDNYEEIYRDIEEVAAERISKRKDSEIAALKAAHMEELETYKTQMERSDQAAHAAKQDARELAENIQGLAGEKEQLAGEKRGLSEHLDLSERQWATACLKRGQRVVRAAHAALTVFSAAVAAFASVMGTDSLALQLTIGGLIFIGAVGLAILGNRVWAGNPLERWIARRRDAAVRRFARESGVERVLTKFELDWDTRTVRRTD